MIKEKRVDNKTKEQPWNNRDLRLFRLIVVIALWLLPAWAVWFVGTHIEWQQGLDEWRVGVLAWYPLIAVLMLFFATVLYQRLPKSLLGLSYYVVATLGMAGVHWWLQGTDSLTLLALESATFSLTLFVVGFSLELFRRIAVMASQGHWLLVVFGGLANIALFVLPGVLIAISLYMVLLHRGSFEGSWLLQTPYLLGVVVAIWYDWRSFRAM